MVEISKDSFITLCKTYEYNDPMLLDIDEEIETLFLATSVYKLEVEQVVTSTIVGGYRLYKYNEGNWIDAYECVKFDSVDTAPEDFCNNNGTYYQGCGAWSGHWSYTFYLDPGVYLLEAVSSSYDLSLILVI